MEKLATQQMLWPIRPGMGEGEVVVAPKTGGSVEKIGRPPRNLQRPSRDGASQPLKAPPDVFPEQ